MSRVSSPVFVLLLVTLVIVVTLGDHQKPFCWRFHYTVYEWGDTGKLVDINIPYRRVWALRNSGARTTILDMEETDTPVWTNGIMFPIFSEEELDDLNKEKADGSYKQVTIPYESISIMHEGRNENARSMKLDPSSAVYIYVPATDIRGRNYPNALYPITQGYLDYTMAGFLKFKTEEYDPIPRFLDTTTWTQYIINNRLMPRRPWIHYPDYWVYDGYLASPDNLVAIPPSLYPEDYAVVFFDELKEGLKIARTSRANYQYQEQFYG